MRLLWAVCALPCVLHGNQSLVLTPGTSLHFSIPNTAPYNALSGMRVEYRLHHWTAPTIDSTLFTLGGTVSAPMLVFQLTKTSELCVLEYGDPAPAYGGEMCADITGAPDVVVRWQRDNVNMRFQYEVRSAQNAALTTYCGLKWYASHNTFGCPAQTMNVRSYAGLSEIGDAASGAGGQIAWLKWYSKLVPVGSGVLVESNPADLADFRFEGNLNDTDTGAAPTLQGQATFAATPAYPPACNIGQQQVFRAGHPAQLDGSGSYSMNGSSPLTFIWKELSGPSSVSFSGSATQPMVNGLVFGSYVFQLTVTDSSGQPSSCTVKDGAVASDDNGVVITNNPTLDALIGPQIRFGANPWPWFDNRQQAAANLQSQNLDLYYKSFWDTPSPGSVTVAANSNIVTGAGTTFTTTYCQGPANPHVAKDGVGVVVWHPTAVPGQTGRRWMDVIGCQSDTQLTTAQHWTPDLPAGTMPFSYADGNNAGTWISNVDPANFYDNVVGFYTLYYRSGIDDYLLAARKLADRFWLSPRIDQGAACEPGSGYCNYPRNLSQLGLVLRALDGRPDMWPGLRAMWQTFMGNVGAAPLSQEVWDAREQGYQLAMVAYCALADPDPAGSGACKTSLSKSFYAAWTPFKGPFGNWPTLWYEQGAAYASWSAPISSVTLTNGSASVVGNGTAWTADHFPFPNSTSMVWFTNGLAFPTDSSQGDPTYYTATFIDATHLTLDRPYAGTSGTHGYMLAGANQIIGYGQEPFTLGILATAFDMAGTALAGTDPATSALAHSYTVTAVNWLKNTAYWPATKALYYQAGQLNCQAPISDSNTACTGGNSASQARTLSAMIMRAVGAAYAYTSDPSLLAYGDLLFSAMYSKPGTGGPNPDGSYVSDLDDTGYYMTGTPPLGSAPKYFGMFFGFGDNSTWPAYRVGKPSAPSTRVVRLATAHPPDAQKMRLTVTEPDGSVSYAECGFAQCGVMVDGRLGDPSVTAEFLSGAGSVIESRPVAVLSER